jgi:hypothetical protein
LSINDLSALVDGLVRADRCGEASKVTLGMLENGLFPVPRVLRFLLNRLAVAGDIDTLTAIGNHLTPVSTAKCFEDTQHHRVLEFSLSELGVQLTLHIVIKF